MPVPEEERQTGEQQEEGEAQNQQHQEGQQEEFDQARALATIQAQRESEKKLKTQLKELQGQIKTFQDAEKAKQDAEKSELQKLQEKAVKLTESLQEAQETVQALRLRHEFGKVAAKLSLKFASVQAQEDAFELADLEKVEIDGQGQVTGLDEAIKELQKSRPYLFSQAEEGDGLGTPKRNGKTGSGKLNQDAVASMKVRF